MNALSFTRKSANGLRFMLCSLQICTVSCSAVCKCAPFHALQSANMHSFIFCSLQICIVLCSAVWKTCTISCSAVCRFAQFHALQSANMYSFMLCTRDYTYYWINSYLRVLLAWPKNYSTYSPTIVCEVSFEFEYLTKIDSMFEKNLGYESVDYKRRV
jgi:hypothetical protein